MSPPRYDTPAQYVATPSELERAASALLRASSMAIDTESDSFYRYKEKVCLLQITAEGVDYIIDPLLAGGIEPLREALTRPGVEKIFHSADGDLVLMERSFGFRPTGPLFDTFIAAQVIGAPQVGLSALAQTHLGVTLDKTWQRHDWARRPLEPAHIDYARGDTHYLHALRDILDAEVTRKGRQAHAREEFEIALTRTWEATPFDPDDCQDIKGARELSPGAMKILRSMYVARERLAEGADLAPFRVVTNEILVALAKAPPRSWGEFSQQKGLGEWALRRWGPALFRALTDGMAPDAQGPSPRPRTARPTSRDESEARLKALKKWRETTSARLGISPGFLVSNHLLGQIAVRFPRTLDELAAIQGVRRWQLAEFGAEWLKVLGRG